jgi:hypothetical protein
MPVRNALRHRAVPDETELRTALIAELRTPNEDPATEPDIVIETPGAGTVHIFVKWTRWGELEQTVRSRIILDAYSEVKGEREAQKVTVAMGLTPEEATRMGID